MKEQFSLFVLLFVTFCRCEVLQTPWEKTNLPLVVRHNSENLNRVEKVFIQLLNWFQTKEELFSKMEKMTETYYQKNIGETKSEKLDDSGFFKSPEYRHFFENLTDLISASDEESQVEFFRESKYQQHGGFMTDTDKDLLLEQLSNQAQQMNEFEKSLKNLSERMTLVETNSNGQMNDIANLNHQLKSNSNQLEKQGKNIDRIGELYGTLKNTVTSLAQDQETAAENGIMLKTLRKDLDNKNNTINQIKESLRSLYADLTKLDKVAALLLNPQSMRIRKGSFCPSELDDGDTCFKLGPDMKCYCFITSIQLTWAEAERYCRWQGMHLLSIETQAENNEIFSKIRNKGGFWTSGKRENKDSDKWIWASTGEQMTKYTNWKNGEPNGKGNENCLELWHPFNGWNDKLCSTKHNIICEA